MQVTDQKRFPPVSATLRNGESAMIRPLAPEDGEALGDFYEVIPRADIRFYCPHPLTRGRARENAAHALRATEVVMVAETGARAIGGYAWCRWPAGA